MQADATWLTATPNIIGCYMLHPFGHPVACCCAKFETGYNFSPVQTDARLLGVVGSVCTKLKIN